MKRPTDEGRALLAAEGWVDGLGIPIQRVILSYRDDRLRAKGKKQIAVSVPDQLFRGVILISIVGVIALLSQYVFPQGATVPSYVHIGLLCMHLSFIGWFVINFIRRRMPSVQIPRRLARGECPGCLYELAGLPPERIEAIEAAIRCPECGAVWGAERIGRSKAEES
ncbi:MAG: hypothetical protein HRU13_00815 [Phycisphaerales bacterium]|nr:hypothetical protein [Phycisphaerales bacterium]